MRDVSPLSPEQRRKRLASASAAFGPDVVRRLKPHHHAWEVVKRVAVGVYNDGFIHAGNLAYLSLLALFPFFILAAAIAHLLGQSQDAQLTVANVLTRLPPNVAQTLREPVAEVLQARTGPLLWLGAIVGLWTATSFTETIRDILRRAYGVRYCAPFWEYRLGSIILILAAVLLLMIAFAASVVLTSTHLLLVKWFPFAEGIATTLGLYRLVPAATLFFTFYGLFFALTPAKRIGEFNDSVRRLESMRTPPSDTRARGRGVAVSLFQGRQIPYVINWDSISLENSSYLPMPDPFETYERHVEALLE